MPGTVSTATRAAAPFFTATTIASTSRLRPWGAARRSIHWDHAFILFEKDETTLAAVRVAEPTKYFVLPWNPTAENMARYLLEVVAPHVLTGLGVVARRVSLWETDEACAVATLVGRPGTSPMPIGSAVIVDTRN